VDGSVDGITKLGMISRVHDGLFVDEVVRVKVALYTMEIARFWCVCRVQVCFPNGRLRA